MYLFLLKTRLGQTFFKAVSILSIVLFAGCGGQSLRSSFTDYTNAFADISNRQMLLNLARLSQRHPSYFLQMGSINATFQFVANAGANAGGTRGESFAGTAVMPILDSVTWGLTAGGSRSEQPSFNFTPLGGGAFAEAVLVPISPNVLYTLFEQGYRVDHLFRTIVDSIEFYNPQTGKCQTFDNTPDEANPKNYSDFLTLCAVARELQIRDLLYVETTSSLNPVPSPTFEHPTVEETLKAGAAGYVLKETKDGSGKYSLMKTASVTGFKLDPLADKVMAELGKDKKYRLESAGKISTNTTGGSGMVIRLRPFISVLYSVANEPVVYDAIVAKDPGFLDNIPVTQQEPVLRINWDGITGNKTPSLVELTYGGKHYEVADMLDKPNPTHNRDVFVLLTYLFNQVSMDPSKLPVQQLIQVN